MCLFPVRATLQEFGKPKLDPEGSLQLPCGKCYECQSKRAVEWSLRARHEISMHDENCFLTLTYDDENLPSYLIVKSEFQKFMKRLRKKTKTKLRYMVSHEYGSKSGRPHHHAIIFGYNPPNQKFLKDSPSGEPLFTSSEIENLWDKGFHSIGTANEKTAYYIASYSLKSNSHDVINPNTGEYSKVRDSMDASKRPAIGRDYFMQNINQLINSNTLLPRYYIKLLERHYPDLLEVYENERMLDNAQKTPRSSQELLARYVILNQKEQNSLGTFRSAPEMQKEFNQYKYHLRYNRDAYKQSQRKKNV